MIRTSYLSKGRKKLGTKSGLVQLSCYGEVTLKRVRETFGIPQRC